MSRWQPHPHISAGHRMPWMPRDAEEMQAAIVAWLRRVGGTASLDVIARCIESGYHLEAKL